VPAPTGSLLPPDPLLISLPGGGPPGEFDYHATGWAFDLLRPADDRKRKTLEYALGYLRDRGVLWFYEETGGGARRYHVAPDPRFNNALAEVARTGKMPPILGSPASVPMVAHARLSRNRTGPQ
jgi:hypothetical protein